jgi:uncharacterized protein (DUF1800 family)
VQSQGFDAWITAQISMAPPNRIHLAETGDWDLNFNHSWWKHTINGEDQLRQRVAFAYSQIFVVSIVNGEIKPRSAASYYDMLEKNAFGNFRTLLGDVTRAQAMGQYLTFLANRKEDPTTGRVPDENYAREVMQLMSIGLYELNNDGTRKLDGSGNPIPTYSAADVSGLAKVFTGLSFYNTVVNDNSFRGGNDIPQMYTEPMIDYDSWHSTSEKKFLGVTIPAGQSDVTADVNAALDRLFNHPNVGPFIGTRLIQQLVTSNPSPAYVGRVAAVFNNNGSGVRGDMGAVTRAVLMDAEARNMSAVTSNSFGKLREPIIRLANWARAFKVTSVSGNFEMPWTHSNTDLAQGPLYASSVFNFWRPGYTPPPTTQLGSRNLLAPEFQLTDEVTVAAYANFIQKAIDIGLGYPTNEDVKSNYASETSLSVDAMLDRINLLLFYGQMSSGLRDRIRTVTSGLSGQTRVKVAVYLSMVSPEYLAQR